MLKPTDRQSLVDIFVENHTENSLSNKLIIRGVAKNSKFTSVDFKYTIFDTCYFRNCIFDSCDFTGCRFIGSNFPSSTFTGCIFDYSYFEKTFIDKEILKYCCPSHDNLKLKFARTLRLNYQQIGDAEAVNLAIQIELESTESHLLKSWKSNAYYYRHKYCGLKRLEMFGEWLLFKAMDLLWGNGEKPIKIIFVTLLTISLMTALDIYQSHALVTIKEIPTIFSNNIGIFLGILETESKHVLYKSAITVLRLFVIALLFSVLIKRINRR